MRVKDQLGRELHTKTPPERIISLVPSQTELLVDLGIEDRLVGVTKFCVHPQHIRKTTTVVGGTKSVRMDKIAALEPDLIIANKEENTLKMVEELQALAPVWISDVVSVADQTDLVSSLGTMLGLEQQANQLNDNTLKAMAKLQDRVSGLPTEKVAYLIWKDPFMAAGDHTFINTMLGLCGWENVIKASRYPQIDLEQLSEADRVLLSTEPFPFKQADVEALAMAIGRPVQLVDGEFFSWYGSRFPLALQYMAGLR